jgi:hypothetical protein
MEDIPSDTNRTMTLLPALLPYHKPALPAGAPKSS